MKCTGEEEGLAAGWLAGPHNTRSSKAYEAEVVADQLSVSLTVLCADREHARYGEKGHYLEQNLVCIIIYTFMQLWHGRQATTTLSLSAFNTP